MPLMLQHSSKKGTQQKDSLLKKNLSIFCSKKKIPTTIKNLYFKLFCLNFFYVLLIKVLQYHQSINQIRNMYILYKIPKLNYIIYPKLFLVT